MPSPNPRKPTSTRSLSRQGAVSPFLPPGVSRSGSRLLPLGVLPGEGSARSPRGRSALPSGVVTTTDRGGGGAGRSPAGGRPTSPRRGETGREALPRRQSRRLARPAGEDEASRRGRDERGGRGPGPAARTTRRAGGPWGPPQAAPANLLPHPGARSRPPPHSRCYRPWRPLPCPGSSPRPSSPPASPRAS